MSEPSESEAQRYVEFETTGEEYWAVDRFDRLLKDFMLEVGDLPEWHKAMSGQGRAWEICSRLYQVGSLMNPDPVVLRSWTRAEIAKEYGIPQGQVDHEIEHAVEYWRLKHARRKVASEALQMAGIDEIDHLTSFSNADSIDKGMVDKLLEAFNFSDIKDETLRAQVAHRILSLKDYLSSPHSRTSARQIIRMEVTLHGLEKILVGYNNKIDRLSEEDPERRASGTEIDSLSNKAQDLDKEIRAISKAHAALQKELGADDIDMTTRKRIFVETVGYIMEKCRQYESDPENVLVDGVFRANEIDWLLEPLGERGPQYRPDISIRMAEALLPENLWDPHYKPTKIQQRVCQELSKIVETMRAVREDAAALPEDDDDDDSAGMEGVDVPLLDMDAETQARVGFPSLGAREERAAIGVF